MKRIRLTLKEHTRHSAIRHVHRFVIEEFEGRPEIRRDGDAVSSRDTGVLAVIGIEPVYYDVELEVEGE